MRGWPVGRRRRAASGSIEQMPAVSDIGLESGDRHPTMAPRQAQPVDSAAEALAHITPLIITYNEAPNIARSLDKLRWARRIVVIDSGSTDETATIVQSYPQAVLIRHPFSDFASQCNYGLTQVDSDWVLSLDADYELSDELARELASLDYASGPAGYRARFVYKIHGRSLRASLYPPRTVLYQKDKASYRNEGHGHRVTIDGEVRPLRGVIYHDDRKPLSQWVASQLRYAANEADYLLSPREGPVTRTDKLRLMGWPTPIGAFFYTLFIKGCVLDGWPGWYYTLQRVFAETLIALVLLERRLGHKAKSGTDKDRARS